jgi:hypothetical protein
VYTGSTAVEEKSMDVVEENKKEESTPVFTYESVPVPPVYTGSTAVEELTSNNILMDLDESDLFFVSP